jgi:hypothetical protein
LVLEMQVDARPLDAVQAGGGRVGAAMTRHSELRAAEMNARIRALAERNAEASYRNLTVKNASRMSADERERYGLPRQWKRAKRKA